LHGFDWFDFVGFEGLTKKQLNFLIYPSDTEVIQTGLRGIYLSNYFKYDGRYHAKIAEDLYDWIPAEKSFDRTFRKISNLDDMHENGIHDYMKFVKFGYGRGTDHANYDIRTGKMTRAEGVRMVLQYDHVKPSDLLRWLEYVSMTEDEFDALADTFRDPRVWSLEKGEWVKNCIDGEVRAYRRVKLT
jgi:hypothetical protein